MSKWQIILAGSMGLQKKDDMKFFDKNIFVISDIYDTHILDRSNWFERIHLFAVL